MNKKLSQEKRLLLAINNNPELPTYEIVRLGVDLYIGCPDRVLRRLNEKCYILGEYVKGKRYKFWSITKLGKDYLRQNKLI